MRSVAYREIFERFPPAILFQGDVAKVVQDDCLADDVAELPLQIEAFLVAYGREPKVAGDSGPLTLRVQHSSDQGPVAGRPDLVEPAKTAFTIGLDDVLLAGSLVLVVGALAALLLLRTPAPARTPVPENA